MASYTKVTNTVSLPVSFDPQTAFPLDARSMFGSLAEATAAALTAENAGSSNTVYYIGMPLTVFENDEVKMYQIQPDKTLKEVGSIPVGDDKTITVGEDGVITMKSFGKEYYKYYSADTIIEGSYTWTGGTGAKGEVLPATDGLVGGEYASVAYNPDGEPTGATGWIKYTGTEWALVEEGTTPRTTSEYKLTTGWKDGLTPKVIQNSETKGYEIAWYEPSTITTEGLSSAIDTLKSNVSTLEGTVADNKKSAEDAIAEEKSRAEGVETKLAGRLTTAEGTISTLNGSADTEGSVKNQIAKAVAEIMDNPDETMNSIKELVEWINSHGTEATAMRSDINTNTTNIENLTKLVGSLPEGATATTIAAYIAEAVGVEEKRAKDAEKVITDKMAAVKGNFGTAAEKDVEFFATAAQGAKADSAVQKVEAGENGHISVDGTDVTVYELPKATTTVVGGVKPDGASINVDENGTASVAAVDMSKVTGLADALTTTKTEAVTAANEYTDENAIAKTSITNSSSIPADSAAASDDKVLSEKAIIDMLTWKTTM